MPQPSQTAFGPVTGADLGDVSSLTMPFARDPFFRLRPPLTREAVALSLDLAAMAYHLSIDEWMQAGWTDISMQVDDTLQSGVTSSMQGDQLRSLLNLWKVQRAKFALRERNPIAQIKGALRQREKSDTLKAVTMIHPASAGRYVVAIGFMGTGTRVYDWISNFRFTTEDGFHKGFYQLTECFEQSAPRILFPDTARELGLERLTLEDIIKEMKNASSRFSLWMAGHSQGAAVMQVFTHVLIDELGVLPQNVVGYGFASPTVATGALAIDPASYPLYHILNSDDVVPRLGALCHLGLCLQYQASDAFRAAAYGWENAERSVAARAALRSFVVRMTDTTAVLEMGVAFFQALMEEKGEDKINELIEKRWTLGFMDKMLSTAGEKAQNRVGAMCDYAREAYRQLTGRGMDEERLRMLRLEMTPFVREYTLREILSAIRELSAPAHSILREQRFSGAYRFIVQRGLPALRPFIWENPHDAPPRKRFAQEAVWSRVLTASASPRRRPAARRHPARKLPGIHAGRRPILLRQKRSYAIMTLGSQSLEEGKTNGSCQYQGNVQKGLRGRLRHRRL